MCVGICSPLQTGAVDRTNQSSQSEPKPMDITPDARLVRAEDRYLSNPVGEEVMLLDLVTGDYIALNEPAARIWEMLQEPRTVRELTDALGRIFDVEPEACLADTLDFLRRIEGLRLLTQA